MFALDVRDVPCLPDYAAAAQKFANTKPWRDRDVMIRPLEKRNKKHCAIYRSGTDSYTCRLYSTDLIKFTPDGEIHVYTGYSSRSTDAFVNAVLARNGVHFMLNRMDPVVFLRNNGPAYFGSGYLLPREDWVTLTTDGRIRGIKPIVELRLNVKKANRIKKQSGYNDFVTWRKAYDALKDGPAFRQRWTHPSYADIMPLLRLRGESWVQLAQLATNERILEAVYADHKEEGVIDQISYDCFQNFRAYQSWETLDRKYRSLV